MCFNIFGVVAVFLGWRRSGSVETLILQNLEGGKKEAVGDRTRQQSDSVEP